MDPGLETDLYKKSLDTFINVWKMLLMAWSNLGTDVSVGLLLQSQFRVNSGIIDQLNMYKTIKEQ